MKKQHVILVLFLFFIIGNSNAQQTKIYTHDNVAYDKALSLYKSEQYLVSQILFEKIKNTTNDTQVKGDCTYYIANSAVRLNQRNADELMERFVEEYPTSSKRNAAFNDVGDYYFKTVSMLMP